MRMAGDNRINAMPINAIRPGGAMLHQDNRGPRST